MTNESGQRDEDHGTRLRRLRMRAWRRGTREMDLILGPFADTAMAELSAPELSAFEALLEENDHDLYRWISERVPGAASGGDMTAPAAPGGGTVPSAGLAEGRLLDRIAAHAASRFSGRSG